MTSKIKRQTEKTKEKSKNEESGNLNGKRRIGRKAKSEGGNGFCKNDENEESGEELKDKNKGKEKR